MASFFKQNAPIALETAGERCWQEFVSALPARWRKHFGAERWRVLYPNSQDKVSSTGDLRPVAIIASKQDILVRRIELPLLSKFRLAALMAFEAPQHVPLPLDQVRLDFRIAKRDIQTSRMLVELVMIRATALKFIAPAAKPGVKPEAVLLSTEYGPWLARRPLAIRWQDRWFSRRHQKLFMRYAIPTALLLVLVLSTQNWAARLADSRSAAVTSAKAQAVGIEPLRIRLAALNDTLNYLASTRNRASAANITEEVARLLPDDAWLQELDIEDQTVRLIGTARHASDLLSIMSTSTLASTPQFEAPLMQSPGSPDNQFDLVMVRN